MTTTPSDKPRDIPQVMVSSTFVDLKEHRQALIDSLIRHDLHANVMENDSARLVDVIESSLGMVRESAGYIGLIGLRYGDTPKCPRRNPGELSLTELEFNEATRLRRPILLFIMGEEHAVKPRDVEKDPARERKLNAFRERAKQISPESAVPRVYAVFNSLEEFKDKISPSVAELSRALELEIVEVGERVNVSGQSTTIPHNLPALQPFFGREDELARIADALDAESRTWGALIDGPGGMGKTSLAIRAAYDASPEAFKRIVFVSLKSRELDDDGERDLSGFLVSGIGELFSEVARLVGYSDLAKSPEDQRPRLLLDALRGTQTLLILDNLESLTKANRDTVFTFVKKLPSDCKAILTSRGRIGSGAEELILEKISEEAALATLADLAESNPALARTSEAERRQLYEATSGKPLLLRWTAGQIGRGSCLTFKDAIGYLRSCPKGNDPLEYIFGDLVDGFSETETRVLCALVYFTLPTKVQHIAEIADCSTAETDSALRSLTNRSLVVPSEELQRFVLVPLVADFLRKRKTEVVAETGDRLESRAYALVVENGGSKHGRFPQLDAAWSTVAAALPRFLAGANDRLQTVCRELWFFLEFTGRFDEALALARDAEQRALAAGDGFWAGWCAQNAAYFHGVREQPEELLAWAERALRDWGPEPGDKELATYNCLRGQGLTLARDYPGAIAALRKAVELFRGLDPETRDVARSLNALGNAEINSGDLEAAERDFTEAVRIAKIIKDPEAVAVFHCNLVALANRRKDWSGAEALARELIPLVEQLGRMGTTGDVHWWMAQALAEQGKQADAIPHAATALEIYERLGWPVASVREAIERWKS